VGIFCPALHFPGQFQRNWPGRNMSTPVRMQRQSTANWIVLRAAYFSSLQAPFSFRSWFAVPRALLCCTAWLCSIGVSGPASSLRDTLESVLRSNCVRIMHFSQKKIILVEFFSPQKSGVIRTQSLRLGLFFVKNSSFRTGFWAQPVSSPGGKGRKSEGKQLRPDSFLVVFFLCSKRLCSSCFRWPVLSNRSLEMLCFSPAFRSKLSCSQ
jgi:hypothetical protein